MTCSNRVNAPIGDQNILCTAHSIYINGSNLLTPIAYYALLGDMPIKFIGKNFALFYPGIKY